MVIFNKRPNLLFLLNSVLNHLKINDMFVNYSLQLTDANFFLLLILSNRTLKFIIFYYCFMFIGLQYNIFIYVDMVDCLLVYIYLQLCDILNELLIFYQNLYLIIQDCRMRKTEI